MTVNMIQFFEFLVLKINSEINLSVPGPRTLRKSRKIITCEFKNYDSTEKVVNPEGWKGIGFVLHWLLYALKIKKAWLSKSFINITVSTVPFLSGI